MDKITTMLVKVRDSQPGQTMAEYALIFAAVLLIAIVGYRTTGTTITSLLSAVDGIL